MPERRARQAELAPRVFGRCRLCGNPAAPPRRYWCSQECVDAWMARSNPAVLRRLVLERDRGVCAGCGVDTIALDAALSAAALGVLTLRRLDRVPGLSRAVEVFAGDIRLGVTHYRAGRRFRMRLRDHLRGVVRHHLKYAKACPCAVCAVAAPWRWRPGRLPRAGRSVARRGCGRCACGVTAARQPTWRPGGPRRSNGHRPRNANDCGRRPAR